MNPSKSSIRGPAAALPKGLRDTFAPDVLARRHMIDTIRGVYELYGFAPLETPAIEYLDALGKYLPDSDSPAGGIFAFRDEDDSWLALRYDLTAPLSRIFSQRLGEIPVPFRRYQVGLVWRNEKPDDDRFREFYQFDIDTVGTASMAADAEVCCVLSDAMEALGLEENYIVRVNNRKALNGVLEREGSPLGEAASLAVLRAIDKFDRLGVEGVRQLLTVGRTDESGAFASGAHLTEDLVQRILDLLSVRGCSRSEACNRYEALVRGSKEGEEGVEELREIDRFLKGARCADTDGKIIEYTEKKVIFDPTVVRGLAYYTGPVFEVSLTFEVTDKGGHMHQFGSVAGGGRYDYLVERFLRRKVPATGASIGVDRLLAALAKLGRSAGSELAAPVVVTVQDKAYLLEYEKMAFDLRRAKVSAEMYLGDGGLTKQLQYADERGAIVAVVAGSREFEAGQVSLKDLRLGRELSGKITQREEWAKDQPAQRTFPRGEMVNEVRRILDGYR
jgi:histidyl-tRNA synthetase